MWNMSKKPTLRDVDANYRDETAIPVVIFHTGAKFPHPETGDIITVDEDDLAFAAVITTDSCEAGWVRLGWQMLDESEGGDDTIDGWPRLDFDGSNGESCVTKSAAEALIAAADQVLVGDVPIWSAPPR